MEEEKEEKISVSLKKSTIELLDEAARKKVNLDIEKGLLDIISLIRSKRGVPYDMEVNFLARIYLVVSEKFNIKKDILDKNPELKKFLDKLNEVNNFFPKQDEADLDE